MTVAVVSRFDITPEAVLAVAWEGDPVAIDAAALTRVPTFRAAFMPYLDEDPNASVYGINQCQGEIVGQTLDEEVREPRRTAPSRWTTMAWPASPESMPPPALPIAPTGHPPARATRARRKFVKELPVSVEAQALRLRASPHPEAIRCRPPATARHALSLATFVAERRRTESHSFTKRANMCADHARTLDACGVAILCRRRRKLIPTAAVLARAQATYRSHFRGAYAPHGSRTMPPYRPIHREVIGVPYRPARRSRPTYGPWTRALGASRSSGQPDPLMTAGQSEPEGWVMRGA